MEVLHWLDEKVATPLFYYVLLPSYQYFRDSQMSQNIASYILVFQLLGSVYYSLKYVFKGDLLIAGALLFKGIYNPSTSLRFTKDIYRMVRWFIGKVLSFGRWAFYKLVKREEQSPFEDLL